MSEGTTYRPRPDEPSSGETAGRQVLSFSGDFCFDKAEGAVESVRDLLTLGKDEVVLDLAGVPLIDSSGLRALLLIHRLCEDAGASLTLDPVSDCVTRIVSMSGLGGLFAIPQPTVHARGQSDTSMDHVDWRVLEHVAASDPGVISTLRDRVSAAAYDAGARGDTLCDIQIAVGEALTNAYKHGSPRKGTDRITVKCMTCIKAVVVEVADEGQPFDPNATPEPNPDDLQPNGMGIYLMRKAMDVVEFTSDCPGNRVRMIKWLPDE